MNLLEGPDGVCIAAFSAIMPLTSAMCKEATKAWDYVGVIRYLSCPDVERPVVFRVERVPVEQRVVPLR